mmetsp:Transcript_12007/g.15009  ORF Transcript_12007/g.15009 Transcript_12007/m.15009 type:complete len:110 (+) Transcript_12007:726-1055(+)
MRVPHPIFRREGIDGEYGDTLREAPFREFDEFATTVDVAAGGDAVGGFSVTAIAVHDNSNMPGDEILWDIGEGSEGKLFEGLARLFVVCGNARVLMSSSENRKQERRKE